MLSCVLFASIIVSGHKFVLVIKYIFWHIPLVYRPGYFTVHPPPPRLQVDQNFLTQKIVADPKMRCHQKSFGIWRVTEAILGQKTCFFLKTYFGKYS